MPPMDVCRGRCPRCGTVVEVAAEEADAETICPQCRFRFRANAIMSEPPAPPPGFLNANLSLRQGPAFEHYREIGLASALWQTIQEVICEPTQTFTTMRPDNGLGLPFLYATLVGLIAGIANQIWAAVLQGFLMLAVSHSGYPGSGAIGPGDLFGFLGGGILGIFCAIPQAPLYAATAMFISGGIYHLMLMMLKANRYPFEATARAMAYATTPFLLTVIPLFGFFVAPIWGLVTNIIALREMHETTTGIALAAVLLPLFAILCCCCLFVLLVPFLGMLLSQ